MPDGGSLNVDLPEKLQPLYAPHRYKVIYGGRGKGASWNIARTLLVQGYASTKRILCAREIQRTIADSVHQLICDQIKLLRLESFYRPTESSILGANGTQFIFAGLRQLDAAKLMSIEGIDIAWVAQAEVISKSSWEILIPTIRKADSEIWVDFNPRLQTDETYKRFVINTPPNTALIEMTWRDNPFFPKVLEEERQYLLSRDTEAYQNVWEGKCRLAVKGALWTYEMIDSSRLAAVPAGVELNRAVVAIDPSVTEEGNEAGIICAARGSDNRGYVLADRTLQGRPEAWARRAVDTWHMFRCDRIVAEANNGGQMIESTINAYDRTVPIKLVNASRGKITRAEPISLLYSRGLISHVGTFTDLEREMCSYSELDVGSARASPNRMDALVWALTELFEVGPVNLDAAFISGNLRTMEEFPA